VVSMRQNKDFLAGRIVSGILDRFFGLFSPRFGYVVHSGMEACMDVCKLMMGSIEVEEFMVTQS